MNSKKGIEGPTWKLISIILVAVFIFFMIVFYPAVAEGAKSLVKHMFDNLF